VVCLSLILPLQRDGQAELTLVAD